MPESSPAGPPSGFSSWTAARLFDVNMAGALNTVRAALPPSSRAGVDLVLISRCRVRERGRPSRPMTRQRSSTSPGLRVELAIDGVSITTAYFAMINTDMIRQSVDEDPAAQALLDTQPRLLRKRISPEEAAGAIVDGLRRRSAGVPPTPVGRGLQLRGLLAPSLDSQLARNNTVQDILGRLDARKGEDLLTS